MRMVIDMHMELVVGLGTWRLGIEAFSVTGSGVPPEAVVCLKACMHLNLRSVSIVRWVKLPAWK